MFTVSSIMKNVVKLIPFRSKSYLSKFYKLTSVEKFEKIQLELIHSSIVSVLKDREYLSVSEWNSIVSEIQKNCRYKKRDFINRSIFDVLLTLRPPNDSMKNAQNFIKAQELTLDVGVKYSLIRLYTKKAIESKLTEEEEQQLTDFCNEFIDRELYLLPELNLRVLLGICATKEWRRAFGLQGKTYDSLNILARKSLYENDIDSVWNVLNGMTESLIGSQILSNETIAVFAKYFDKNPKDIPANVEKLLTFCQEIQVMIKEPTIKEFTDILSKHGHHAKLTTSNELNDSSVVCNVCGNILQTERITDEAIINLRDAFFENVVKSGVNTTPKEWEEFEQVIKEHGPFDIVIDGLNVAFGLKRRASHIPDNIISKYHDQPCSFSFANAVKQLTDDGKRVLVIGKKMNSWPKIDDIRKISTVFVVKEESADDLFVLYAALSSGQNSYFLSNDSMNDHKTLIGKEFRHLYELWQQEHRYRFTIETSEQFELVKTSQLKLCSRKVGNFWHLPFVRTKVIDSKTCYSSNLPKNWACIQSFHQ